MLMVFNCLTTSGFVISLAKCEFFECEVKMLGFQIDSGLDKLYHK